MLRACCNKFASSWPPMADAKPRGMRAATPSATQRGTRGAASDPRAACLERKRIVYIGDSTARYEYLAVALLAHHGVLPPAGTAAVRESNSAPPSLPCTNGLPSPLYERWVVDTYKRDRASLPATLTSPRPAADGCSKSWDDWDLYYRLSDEIFGGREACDCWRARCCRDAFESRVYRGKDVSISYHAWYGDLNPMRGTWDTVALAAGGGAMGRGGARRGTGSPAPSARQPRGVCPAGQRGNVTWELSVASFVKSLVRPGILPPTHIILSPGWHSTERYSRRDWEAIRAAGARAMRAGARVFWRTTPRPFNMTKEEEAYVLGLRGIRTTLEDRNASWFAAAGWDVYPAHEIVRRYDELAGRSAAGFMNDHVHLTTAATRHLVGELLSRVLCRDGDGHSHLANALPPDEESEPACARLGGATRQRPRAGRTGAGKRAAGLAGAL